MLALLVIRPEADALAEFGDRLFQFPLVTQGVAETLRDQCIVAILELYSSAQNRDGLLECLLDPDTVAPFLEQAP